MPLAAIFGEGKARGVRLACGPACAGSGSEVLNGAASGSSGGAADLDPVRPLSCAGSLRQGPRHHGIGGGVLDRIGTLRQEVRSRSGALSDVGRVSDRASGGSVLSAIRILSGPILPGLGIAARPVARLMLRLRAMKDGRGQAFDRQSRSSVDRSWCAVAHPTIQPGFRGRGGRPGQGGCPRGRGRRGPGCRGGGWRCGPWSRQGREGP